MAKAASVEFVPHDLRRTAATFMTRMGISRLVVGKILNHVESGITKVYDRYSYDEEKREALALWGDKVAEIIGAGQRASPEQLAGAPGSGPSAVPETVSSIVGDATNN